MTAHELSRLERLEQFVQRLTLGSYVAKAAAEGTRHPAFERPDQLKEALARIQALERGNNPATGLPRPDELTRRVNALEAKVRRLDDRLDSVYEGTTAPTPAQTAVREGEQTLAKAQQATRRAHTPDGLLRRAERVFNDPVSVGAVQGYLSLGQVAKAVEMVERAEAQQERADEDDALEAVQNGVNGDVVGRLTDELTQTKEVLSAVLRRVAVLEESAQQTPAAAPNRTVAKAQQGRQGQRPQKPQAAATAQQLLARADGVVDSPVRMGQLSSMVQSGQLREAQRLIEQLELAHEARVKSAERRALR
jgi:hypothetical protein